jgi:hypothetical protein
MEVGMVDRGMEALAARVGRLERENRRLRRGGAAALLGLAGALVMGQGPRGDSPKTVEAERFLLRDAGGKARAELALRADGSPHLEFRDGAGNPRAGLGLQGEAAFLSLTDAKGRGGTILRVQPNGRPNITLTDANGTRRAVLFLSDDGTPTLAFSDGQRRSRVVLNVLGNGFTSLSLSDAFGRLRAALDLEPDGSPSLILYDENRRSRAILGQTELEGRNPAALEKRRASSLVLLDENGTVIWRAP